jgi:hypothetical protein
MFILVPAQGIFARFVMSKSIENIKKHLKKEYKCDFMYEEKGTLDSPNISVYKDVSSKKFKDRILVAHIQNMEIYEV